jgi:type II secretory pathway pseudopilin PulG
MNCGNTVLSNREGHGCRAMTLVELLIAVGIGTVLLGMVAIFYVSTARSFAALGNYDALNQESLFALDTLSRDVRQAKGLTAFTTNQLTFVDHDGSSLIYVWDPAPTALTFSRIKGGQTKVLLRQCDYLNFEVHQQNPTNDFLFYPTASPAEVRVIDVSWRCSRQIMRQKVNTETSQSATIVLRNR